MIRESLTDGSLLFTGLHTFVLSLGITLGIILQPQGPQAFTYLYDHWIPLVSAAVVMSTAQAVFVYVNSFYSKELLALGGNSGVFIYDVGLTRCVGKTCCDVAYTMPSFTATDSNLSGSSVVRSTLPFPISHRSTSKRSTSFDRVSSYGPF